MRKRSKYKPRPLINPLARVLERCSLVKSHESAVVLKIKNHQALLDITQGRGSRQVTDILIAAMNMSEALYRVNQDLGADIHEDVRAAQDALYAMCKRGAATGRFVFTGEELQAMNLGMDIHDAQLDACTILDLENANALVQKELRSKKVRVIYERSGNEV